MKIAAAYIRVSTDDQLEYSPASQLIKIKEFAKSHDYILTNDYIFMDEGISGRTAVKRPAFNQMIALAKTKPTPFDTILVWKFSRFARNREDSIVYKSMLKKQCKINVVSVSEPVGDDKMSVLVEAMIEAMDEYYSINLAEEVKRGMTQKVKQGGVVSVAPYGYKIENGQYVVVPEQAELVKGIFTDYVNGMNTLAITRKYSELGVRTRYGNKPDKRFIDYLLHNPIYAGKIRWCTDGAGASKRDYDNPNIIIVDGTHEPIISQELFEKTQKRIEEVRNLYPKYQRPDQSFQYMLKGLVRCHSCGATLTNTKGKIYGLQCHNYARGSCPTSHYISQEKIERAVIEEIKEKLLTNNFNVAEKTVNIPDTNADLSKLLERENSKLERVKAAYADGIDTLDEYKKNKAEILNNISAIEKEIKKYSAPKKQSKKSYAKKVTSVLNIVTSDTAIPEEKNIALRSIIEKIVFSRTKNEPDTLEIFFK